MSKQQQQIQYIAVSKGRKPGIYTSFEQAQAQTDNYEGARWGVFRTQSDAQLFLQDYHMTHSPKATHHRDIQQFHFNHRDRCSTLPSSDDGKYVNYNDRNDIYQRYYCSNCNNVFEGIHAFENHHSEKFGECAKERIANRKLENGDDGTDLIDHPNTIREEPQTHTNVFHEGNNSRIRTCTTSSPLLKNTSGDIFTWEPFRNNNNNNNSNSSTRKKKTTLNNEEPFWYYNNHYNTNNWSHYYYEDYK
jgi:hypothetical protein